MTIFQDMLQLVGKRQQITKSGRRFMESGMV